MRYMLRNYCINSSHILKNSKIDDDSQMVYFITFIIGIFGLTIHLFLLFFFYNIALTEMAYFNILSIFMWLLGLYYNHNGLHTYAIYSFNTEVLFHSILATMYMGTDSGFQFYLWSISALYILDFKLPYKKALFMSLLLIMVFAFLYLLFNDVNIYYEHINILNFLNIIISGAPLIFALAMVRELYSHRELKLEDEGMKDSLTNLYNRSYIFKKTIFDLNKVDSISNKAIVVMCDIDHFKNVNDNYGHAEGDYILQKVAILLNKSFRESDIIVRWGGEEFLIILHNITLKQAYEIIDTVREKIFNTIHIQESPLEKISMSFGISQLKNLVSLEEVISQADEALYLSKNRGRNRVTLFEDIMK